MYHIIYILIAIMALCVSCTSTDGDIIATLDHAESVMEEHPDSALAMLDTLRSESLRTEKDRARYALLYTQARIKNQYHDSNDSLINVAVNYYSNNPDEQTHLMLAMLYHGVILMRNDSIIPSTKSLIKALDIAEVTNNYFYASIICREICVVFQQTFNPAEEVNYAKKAYDYMQKSGRQPFMDWSLYDLAEAYHNHRMNQECQTVSYQLLDSLKKRPDEELKKQILGVLVRSLIASNKEKESIVYLRDLCSSPVSSSEDMAFLGLCYALTGQNDSAAIILHKLNATPDAPSDIIDGLKYEIYTRNGNRDSAFKALKSMHRQNEALIYDRFKQSATLSVLQHHEQEKENAKRESRTARTILWLTIGCSILFLSTSTAIIFIIRRKQRYEHLKNEAIAQKLHQTIQLRAMEQRKSESLSETVEQKQTTIDQLTDEINQINDAVSQQKQIAAFHATKHYQMIDKACRILWENPSKDAASGKLTSWLDNLTKEMGSSPEKLKALEDIANQCFDNIMADLRKALPNIKEEDYKLFLFNLFGLSSAAIARLIDADKIEPVYTRKKRLRGKLKELEDNKGERFLKYLQNDRDSLDFL